MEVNAGYGDTFIVIVVKKTPNKRETALSARFGFYHNPFLLRSKLDSRCRSLIAKFFGVSMKKSFSFVLDQIEVQANLPIEPIPNHVLQRADDEQITKIKEKLRFFGSSEFHEGLYECRLDKQINSGTPEEPVRMVRLPPERWRYWVVAFDGPNSDISDLEIASALLLNELRFGFTVIKNKDKESFSWSPEVMSEYSSFFRLIRHPSVITQAEIQQIGANFSALRTVKQSFPAIYRTAQRFHLLKRLPASSVFLVIGYFSVIEALITHAPKLTEPMDSLTHQMKTKMNLLSKRLQRRLNYDGFFETTDGDKVWGKLYGYRSKLAHGDLADFQNDFKLLHDNEHALQFLNETAKLLILYAMKEPEFMLDLKKC